MIEFQFFSPCPRGLENLLAQEILDLRGQNVQVTHGGVSYRGDWSLMQDVNLNSRLATRVLLRMGQGGYRNEQDIYALARNLSWHEWFTPRETIRVFTTAVRSPLRSIDFATLKVKDGVCDAFRDRKGVRPSVDTTHPDVRIHLFLTDREATIYLDTSGEALYRRGYKRAKVEAPLKENLAAGILMLSGWKAGLGECEPLLDPMCGSGTFLLEAAHMALNVAPGLGRRFAFEKLAAHDINQWGEVVRTARARAYNATQLPIFGSDIWAEQVARTRQNLAAAGLEKMIKLECSDILKRSAPASEGVLVANPPYGVRLGEKEDLDAFYPLLGDTLKKQFAGWRCYFLSGDTEFPKRIGLKASKRTPLFNGAIDCRLYEYKMIAGSARTPKNDTAPAE